MSASSRPMLDAAATLMLAALATVWGGSFFLAEIALREVPPLTIALHRVAWAVPVLALIVRLRGIPWPRAPGIWGAYLVMGALNNAIPFSLIFWAQQRIDSGLAAILNGTTALFGAVAAGLLLADERLTAHKIAGALIGLGGVAVIMGPDALRAADPAAPGQIAVLAAAMSYALASVWGKARLSGQPPLMNALGMVMGSACLMLPVAWLVEGPPTLALSLPVAGALAAIAVLSTAAAYCLYFAILVRAGAANLMLVTLLIPPVAMLLGTAVLGERLGATVLGGFALIALGLVVTDGRALRACRNPLR